MWVTCTLKWRVCVSRLLRQRPIKINKAAAADISLCDGETLDIEGWFFLGQHITSLLLLPLLLPQARCLTARPRWERMRRRGSKSGQAHRLQDSASTRSTALQSTAEVATLRLHILTLASLLIPSFCGSPFGGKDSWLYGKRRGHRSPFHRCLA